ncbi:MAG: hypothetical protein J4431_00315 [Candidatus Aenigmarchaeota archaeon]|nr:hypothetical protein [Candidatus Aenigmarchaeota archaeon]
MSLDKPKSVTVQVKDRKANKSESFVIYGMTLKEAVTRIKKALGKASQDRKE